MIPKFNFSLVAVLLIVTAVQMTLFTVDEREHVIKFRFGEIVKADYEPGLHFKIPFVEEMLRVPVQRQLKQEFGFRTNEPGLRTQFTNQTQQLADESVMLTGDLNVAVVEWIVQYRVADPYLYLFKVRNLEGTSACPTNK